MLPPSFSTTGRNKDRLDKARGWADYNFAPTLPRPPAHPPEVAETEPESLSRLAREAKAVPREVVEEQRRRRQQTLSEPITVALGLIISAAGAVSETSGPQTGPALVTHVNLSSDIEASAAVLTNGAFVVASEGILPAGSLTSNFNLIIPLWDLDSTINRNSIAPGAQGASLWFGPRRLIPWATFRINLVAQINAAITRHASCIVTFQRVSAEFREPDLDLLVMRQRRTPPPPPPDVHGLTRVVPTNVLVKGPGYQRQVSLASLDPDLRRSFLEAWSQSKPFPGIIPL